MNLVGGKSLLGIRFGLEAGRLKITKVTLVKIFSLKYFILLILIASKGDSPISIAFIGPFCEIISAFLPNFHNVQHFHAGQSFPKYTHFYQSDHSLCVLLIPCASSAPKRCSFPETPRVDCTHSCYHQQCSQSQWTVVASWTQVKWKIHNSTTLLFSTLDFNPKWCVAHDSLEGRFVPLKLLSLLNWYETKQQWHPSP